MRRKTDYKTKTDCKTHKLTMLTMHMLILRKTCQRRWGWGLKINSVKVVSSLWMPPNKDLSFENILEISQIKQNHICVIIGSCQGCTLNIEISDCNVCGFFGHLLDVVYRKIFLTSLIAS